MLPATRGDGLRLQLAGTDVNSVAAVVLAAGLAGLVVLAAAAKNGAGIGQVTLVPALSPNPNMLRWQAPGSVTPGAAQPVTIDGDYLLEDGADRGKWIRVRVYVARLPASGVAIVQVTDRYNELGLGDVAAADALTGTVTTTQFTLKNVSPALITGVLLWIDASVAGMSVSSDGTNFYTPTSSGDAHVLAWSSIAAGASVNLWVRRTIGSSAASNARVLHWLHYSWTGA